MSHFIALILLRTLMMEFDNTHLRHILLFLFRQGKKASEARLDICSIYGDEALTERTCYKWFSKFKQGDFSLEDAPRSGGPRKVNNEDLEALLEDDPGLTQTELAMQLGVDQSTISLHLHELGKIWKAGKIVPHKMTPDIQNHRLNICVSLRSRQKKKSFLHLIVTGDETPVYYENPAPKKFWLDPGQAGPSSPKLKPYRNKVLLCVWWDSKGILYQEFLSREETVNAKRYSNQLQRLQKEIQKKRPVGSHEKRRKVILLHDNARPHIAKATCGTIEDLGWEVLPHPAYSPDLAPSDYHLFHGLKTFLRDKNFKTREDIEKVVLGYFNSKNDEFFWRGIHDLPNRWEKVIANDGNYFD
jgi:histone-lysine N-methyltransferase SETMAR